MNKKNKCPWAKFKGTAAKVASLCIVCTLYFMASGCERQDSSPAENAEEPGEKLITSEVKEDYNSYFFDYKGEKVYLSLNTKYAFLSVKEPQLPVDIRQRGITAEKFLSDDMDKKWYQGKQGTRRYWTELSVGKNLTAVQYLELLEDIKRQNRDVIIAPYFKDQRGDKLGVSHIFYVKLKQYEDVILLEQMAEQTGSMIVEQDAYMPLWFILSLTEMSKLNALEIANLCHESELFEASEASFVAYGVSIAH